MALVTIRWGVVSLIMLALSWRDCLRDWPVIRKNWLPISLMGSREFAVRHALGASRARIVSHVLVESAMLAAGGALVGLAIAFASVELLDWLRPTNLPRQSQLGIDVTITAFAIGLGAIVCLVCGSIPALRITRREHMDPLRSGRSGPSAPGIRRVQRALVVAEVALSIVPLIGGGLMLRSFWNLTHAPLGFDPSGLVTARLQMSFRAYPDLESRLRLITSAVNEVRQLPGVEAVSAAGPLPMPRPDHRSFAREGAPDSGELASQQPSEFEHPMPLGLGFAHPRGEYDLLAIRGCEHADPAPVPVRPERPVGL